ncbi:MAG: radical SAM protein [Thermoplasmata archaeon]|nr:radical SAM protein [Thermoplasmata archaeon]
MPIKYTDILLRSCTGTPPKGCRYCDRGTKMVLYITGICTQSCFYCPLSEEKKDRDVIYANERMVEGPDWMDQVMEEAHRMNALGTGITGGDPLVAPERTEAIIRRLKEEFGRKHHIHLYTAAIFEKDILARLKDAGLDEIRFHPPIALWTREAYERPGPAKDDIDRYISLMSEARRLGLDVGFEVPAVPDAEGDSYSQGLYDLLSWAAGTNMKFVNVNELEASHTNMEEFARKGYELVGDSMAVEGSRDLAWSAMDAARVDHPDTSTVFHFCSSPYKDSVQLRNRLKRTANVCAKPYEVITEDGTLIRGVIVTDDPGILMGRLHDQYDIPLGLMEDREGRILLAPWVLDEIAGDLKESCYISEVYPTWDGLEVERTPLQVPP